MGYPSACVAFFGAVRRASGYRASGAGLALLAALAASSASGDDAVKVVGYLDFRKPGFLIVDAQRVAVGDKTAIHAGGIHRAADIPLGYEITAKGRRGADGTIVAAEIEAKPNGMAFLEKEVLAETAQTEKAYLQAKEVYEQGPDGKKQSIGALHDSGPKVERARRIVDRILPSYVDPKKVRVYVVDNKEWNAMAMANYSIYVYDGLMNDLDDDELAIVLGHELTHATHEHSAKQAKKGLFSGIAGEAAQFGSQYIKNDLGRAAAQEATALGVTTFGNAYSREYEDQADRVGLRYVYEAGYDYTKAPKLWEKFAKKYGDQDKVTNFFFGNHSLSSQRAKALTGEIARNYSDPAKDPPTHAAKPR
jgi:Zn-dependent protease with chaperone function